MSDETALIGHADLCLFVRICHGSYVFQWLKDTASSHIYIFYLKIFAIPDKKILASESELFTSDMSKWQSWYAPLLFAYVSLGRKMHMVQQGLEPRTSRIPCEHSDHWAAEPHGRPVTISRCLIRFDLLGTMPEPTRRSLCCSQPKHGPTLATKCQRGGKSTCPTGTRTQDLSHTVWELWPLRYQAHGRPVTIWYCGW